MQKAGQSQKSQPQPRWSHPYKGVWETSTTGPELQTINSVDHLGDGKFRTRTSGPFLRCSTLQWASMAPVAYTASMTYACHDFWLNQQTWLSSCSLFTVLWKNLPNVIKSTSKNMISWASCSMLLTLSSSSAIQSLFWPAMSERNPVRVPWTDHIHGAYSGLLLNRTIFNVDLSYIPRLYSLFKHCETHPLLECVNRSVFEQA